MQRIRVPLAANVPVKIDDGAYWGKDRSLDTYKAEKFPSEGREDTGKGRN